MTLARPGLLGRGRQFGDRHLANDFDKHRIPDLGQKLAHLAGLLGAYLPQRVFTNEVQKQTIDCDTSGFSRLKIGERQAANWELGRFIDLFDLSRHGFDYRLFLHSYEAFDTALRTAGVGSYGTSVGERLREALRSRVDPRARITIRSDMPMNVGGIGHVEDDNNIPTLTSQSRVSLRVPLYPSPPEGSYILLLHDFPAVRGTSCLMPSPFAPDQPVTGQVLGLPQASSGLLSFPVGGAPGYRCLYGIQSEIDLADYIGLQDTDAEVQDLHAGQVAQLADLLSNAAAPLRDRIHLSFGEYLLK